MTGPRTVHDDDAVSIWQGDALALPFPDQSVDLIVTSPPYFALRSYTDDGEHYDGQVGSEPTPGEYVDALIAATREMVRVVKPAGSIWINLGDKYSTGNSGQSGMAALGEQYRGGGHTDARAKQRTASVAGRPPKSLLGLPWRYALRVVDELGLILRRDQIWSKPNGLPESVTDRTRSSHEYLFHFVKQPTYYSAVDEIREEYAPETAMRYRSGYNPDNEAYAAGGPTKNGVARHDGGGPGATNPLGKLPGSVWTIPTQPLRVPWGYGVEAGRIARYFTDERDALGWLRLSHRTRRRRIRRLPDHFAAFPLELPRRIIRGWSPSGICVDCGEGRRPVTIADPAPLRDFALEQRGGRSWNGDGPNPTRALGTPAADPNRRVTGYACACDAPTAATRPAVVLDPFGGTGTTALVAKSLGRIGWYVDLSADYCRLGRWRVTDPGERARALEVRKPPPVPVGSDALFDLEGA